MGELRFNLKTYHGISL